LGIHSAEFLQRSGVGPRTLLDNLGIPVIRDNPNVGTHFHNQLIVTAVFSANPADKGVPDSDPQALYTGGAFLPILIPEDDPKRRGYQLIGASPAPGTFLLILIPLQPHSPGTVRIQSTDPLAVSLADNNYLGDPTDLDSMVAGFQVYVKNIAIALANIDPLYQLLNPPMAVIDDTDALKAFITNNFNHSHHWMSSNRMAKSEADGVVDGYGRVFGVDGLTVVDNSIAPVQSDGNPSGPIYFFSNVIADKIIRDR
jgi:choline dehydrogenase